MDKPDYLTDKQWNVYNDHLNGKSFREIAKELDISFSTVRDYDKRCKALLAKHGHAPEHDMTKTCPDGYLVKGVSTYYNQDGKPTGQWVKTNIDLEKQMEFIQEAVAAFMQEIPKITPMKFKGKYDTDVIPWFQIGDAHLGMLAHDAETGQNFDLKIAERELCAAFSILFDECKPSERCVINDLGDFTHYENMEGETQASRHSLDYDGRFPKMITVYAKVMRFIVEKALSKFKYVDVIINQGNHSRTNDVWMATLLRNCYEHTSRVNVLDNDQAFIPYRMGNTFVLAHHSDKCKPNKLVGVMANDYSQDWGEAEFRYIDIGHYHHKMLKEECGVVIEMWNTLAPRDKYANDGGWRSRQSITRVDRSKTYGEIGRRVLSINEIRDYILSKMKNVKMPNKRRKVHTV